MATASPNSLSPNIHSKMALTYVNKDLSSVPVTLKFVFIEKYIQQNTSSSGKEYISKGIKYYREKYIHGISVIRDGDECKITARCYHSQRINEEAHKLHVLLCQDENVIRKAICSCVKGMSQACGHIIGLLYQIAEYKMEGRAAVTQDIVKTSLPQTWHQPRGKKICGQEVQDMAFTSFSKNEPTGTNLVRNIGPGIASTLYNPMRKDLPPLQNLHNALAEVFPESLILPSLQQPNHITNISTKFGNFTKGCAISYQQKLSSDYVINVYDGISYPDLPMENKIITNYSIEGNEQIAADSIKLTLEEIHSLDVQTRLQGQSELWHKLRSNRITATKINRIKTRKKDFEVLATILKSTGHKTTKAMADGIADEPKAAFAYIESHPTINIYPCGIVISPWAPWIAVSPDRKVYDPARVPTFGLLEIKCPRVSSVLECKKYLANLNGVLRLKQSHEYYTQVQAQLAITGLSWCDFYVWCKNDSNEETIYFDPIFWQEVKDKVDTFFFKYFIKY